MPRWSQALLDRLAAGDLAASGVHQVAVFGGGGGGFVDFLAVEVAGVVGALGRGPFEDSGLVGVVGDAPRGGVGGCGCSCSLPLRASRPLPNPCSEAAECAGRRQLRP